MARRNLIRKSILKRKDAFVIETQADVTPTTVSSSERQESEVDVFARDSLEVNFGWTDSCQPHCDR